MSTKDPRREDLAKPYARPHPDREVPEPFGASVSQTMSMGVMLMRSKYLAWVSLLISLSAWMRDRPSVSKKSGKSPWLGIMISFSSLVVAYMSILIPQPSRNITLKGGSTTSPPDPSPAPDATA